MAGNDTVDHALNLTRNLNPQGMYSHAAEVARNHALRVTARPAKDHVTKRNQ